MFYCLWRAQIYKENRMERPNKTTLLVGMWLTRNEDCVLCQSPNWATTDEHQRYHRFDKQCSENVLVQCHFAFTIKLLCISIWQKIFFPIIVYTMYIKLNRNQIQYLQAIDIRTKDVHDALVNKILNTCSECFSSFSSRCLLFRCSERVSLHLYANVLCVCWFSELRAN